VLVGGDGSVHAVAGFDGPAREIALIPAGKANNIARCLGIPLHAPAAAELAAHGAAQPVDAIEAVTADGRRQVVVESVSVGFLAHARAQYHAENSADLLAGGLAGAAALTHFHPMAATVEHGHTAEKLELAQLFVANLPLYEFGLQVAPFADPTDATLDVVGLEAPTRHAVLGMLKHLRDGSHVGRPGFHHWRAPHVRLVSSGVSPVIADSANLGSGAVELRALPAALHVVRT
jgi:diacylglycerol kinase family enzyme